MERQIFLRTNVLKPLCSIEKCNVDYFFPGQLARFLEVSFLESCLAALVNESGNSVEIDKGQIVSDDTMT